MATKRVFPAIAVGQQSLKFNGRTYSAAPGAYLDVPEADANTLSSNGWTSVALSGATSARPAAPGRGQFFIDTGVGKVIVFDGATWRDPMTGAAA